jgi:hypothetical protein
MLLVRIYSDYAEQEVQVNIHRRCPGLLVPHDLRQGFTRRNNALPIEDHKSTDPIK